MRDKTPGRDVFVPIEGFVAEIDGQPVNFTKYTFVREGHPILDKYGHLFKPLRVQYDVEAATAAPGEVRR